MARYQTPKILIVDDCSNNCEVIIHVLSNLKVEFFQASDGPSALSLMAKHQFALVILDADMPDMDGYQVINSMRAQKAPIQHTPVLLLTSNFSDARQSLYGSLMACVESISKPTNANYLVQRVQFYLDIDHHRQQIQMIHEEEEKLLETMEEGILGVDTNGMIVFANGAAIDLLRSDLSELVGNFVETIFQEPNHNIISNWKEHPIVKVCERETILQVNRTDFWRLDGTQISVKFLAVPISGLEKINMVIAFKELKDKVVVQQELAPLTRVDFLTGLPDKTHFIESLDAVMNMKMGDTTKQQAAILLDLAHLKNINDSLGYSIGDKLLLAVGDRLQRNISECNLLARMEGGAFAFLLTTGDMQQIIQIADKIVAQANESFLVDGHEIYIKCRMGIVIYPNNGDTAQVLLKNAEIALQRAKLSGENYEFYTKEVQQTLSRAKNREAPLSTE